MPTEVRHRTETGQPPPVVRLSGVLAPETLVDKRARLHASLQRHPGPLVLDLSELRVADREALASFNRALREATDWLAVDIVLCSPVATTWESTGLPVRPDLDAALDVLDGLGPTERCTVVLEPVVGAARRSRELVTEACARWELPELAGPACIVVTELVNNVVAHARTPMTVWLAAHGATLTVAVRDDNPTPPVARGPVSPTAYGGRGLLLIDSVSRRWGAATVDGGKVVWAVLEPEDDEPPVNG